MTNTNFRMILNPPANFDYIFGYNENVTYEVETPAD